MNTIQLTPEIENLIAQQIKTGKYQDDLAVIKRDCVYWQKETEFIEEDLSN
ncbi:MAG UNVERIFIED_CONTAM: hypothetical protein LVR29_01030 [Microcystis novacekii LVE1205-3]|jgi:Arc/MetJ-type ribon-helix-helix transcriptional regulator